MGKLIRNGIEFSGVADSASHVQYDNTESGLEAVNVQQAVDELSGNATVNGKELPVQLYVQDIPSKNLLPTAIETKTINGVTFTVNDDGSVTVNGTATVTAEFDFTSRLDTETRYRRLRFGVGTYAISGCPSGGGSTKYEIGVNTTENNAEKVLGHDYGDGGTFEVSAQDANKLFGVWIIVRQGQTVNNLTFYPMIRLASITDYTYVPYAKTNVELSKMFLQYKDYTKASISISGDGGYGFVGNFHSDIGVPNEAYVISYYIRGWSGSPGALSLLSSSDGKTLYIMSSKGGTITSINVRVFYMLY